MNQYDFELLRLASLAAGEEFTVTVYSDGTWDTSYEVNFKPSGGIGGGTDVKEGWNPLVDDGDAFRLASKLLMKVNNQQSGVVVRAGSVEVSEMGYSRNVAARRAIVRVAAEIGKNLNK